MAHPVFRRISVALFWPAVGLGVLWIAGARLLSALDYAAVSALASPDGRMVIHEFRSSQDGVGHAPYGQTLALSRSARLAGPDDGYVFFAGYCSQPLRYGWRGNEEVFVRCVGGGRDGGPRTLASVMYGIRVVYSDR